MSREQYAGGLTICRPDDSGLRRRIWRCPTCECRTETVVRYEAWYDPTVVCCRCGDSWGSEGRFERPFHRHWRRDAVRRARPLWDLATYGPPPGLEIA